MGSAATGRPGSGRGQGGGRAFAEPSGEPHAAQVAILRAQGRPAEASRRLCEHLQVVCSDADAWLELHALYLARQQARRAAFCIEELILVNPMAYMYHIRYAEILYTLGCGDKGTPEQLRARQWAESDARDYAHSLPNPTGQHARAVRPAALRAALFGLEEGREGARHLRARSLRARKSDLVHGHMSGGDARRNPSPALGCLAWIFPLRVSPGGTLSSGA